MRESNVNLQLSAQSQKQRHQTTGRRVLLHEMFRELSFVMASTTITELPVSVDSLLTRNIGQRQPVSSYEP